MTVSELAATSTPAVLVPLERVGQLENARVLERAGGGVIVRQSEVGTLADRVTDLLGDSNALVTMGAAAGRTARPEAADVIAGRLLELADG
jgi:UDP-N-acetylglucosamine--N-acetylmuramyl-(pentapeptide) pyrophosphoryl-undecaprenol N-acetylglucosamine transferase